MDSLYEAAADADLTILLQQHRTYDLQGLSVKAQLLLDTRGATRRARHTASDPGARVVQGRLRRGVRRGLVACDSRRRYRKKQVEPTAEAPTRPRQPHLGMRKGPDHAGPGPWKRRAAAASCVYRLCWESATVTSTRWNSFSSL